MNPARTTSLSTTTSRSRIEARLAERKAQLEADLPGITELAVMVKEVFGAVSVRRGEMEGYKCSMSPPSRQYVRKKRSAER